MDLNKLFAVGEAKVELKHPVTGEVLFDEEKTPKELGFTIIGKHTREYKKLERAVGFAAIKRNKKHNIDSMTLEQFESITEENDEAALDLHVQMITDLNVIMDGKKLKCTPVDLKFLFTDQRTSWVYDQFKADIDNAELFFKS